MVSPLFTAFALIACGRAEVPPAPAQQTAAPEIRALRPDKDAEADRPRRRG
jgi:hypothetical protein